eukprot:CAMPEP_0185255038 /NCGR_PEP_ID=MMETSP1359-20130426/4011_1 /TAXON_ID=552665 /ORGANISM="Bigelowiella longifila, Strain CCMP242" /LENGTH=84 /DNA_ID=CAMNT_0027838613 /DNA_START=200 /DNA_END=454 /DNA_ORIENTATION=+
MLIEQSPIPRRDSRLTFVFIFVALKRPDEECTSSTTKKLGASQAAGKAEEQNVYWDHGDLTPFRVDTKARKEEGVNTRNGQMKE